MRSHEEITQIMKQFNHYLAVEESVDAEEAINVLAEMLGLYIAMLGDDVRREALTNALKFVEDVCHHYENIAGKPDPIQFQ
jgi:hypothetical protein